MTDDDSDEDEWSELLDRMRQHNRRHAVKDAIERLREPYRDEQPPAED